jgi:hypothetical protein
MANYSEAFLKRTIEAWQPRFKETLTLEDAREIAVHWTALLKLVIDIHREDVQTPSTQPLPNKEGQ